MGNIYLIITSIIFIFSILYFWKEQWIRQILGKIYRTEKYKVSYENSKIALEKIGSWTTWLTGLQTAAIGAIGLMIGSDKACCIVKYDKNLAFLTLLFFGFSIIFSTFLLCSIPSIQQRLNNSKFPKFENDIYTKQIFTGIPLTLQHMSSLIHIYFCLGIVSFASFIFTFFS